MISNVTIRNKSRNNRDYYFETILKELRKDIPDSLERIRVASKMAEQKKTSDKIINLKEQLITKRLNEVRYLERLKKHGPPHYYKYIQDRYSNLNHGSNVQINSSEFFFPSSKNEEILIETLMNTQEPKYLSMNSSLKSIQE